MRLIATALLLLATLSCSESPQDSESGPPPHPGVRNAHSMSYDSSLGAVVMFGGADETEVRADTWTWDGAHWALLGDSGPPGRTFASMAHDAARGQTLLFGGNRVLFGRGDEGQTFLDDTWLLENGRWRRHSSLAAPPARAEAAMAYDPQRRRIVLFGGYSVTQETMNRLADTWEWDGSQWTMVSGQGPPAGNGASMAFQGDPGRLVLFGGRGAQGTTWTWTEDGWQDLGADAPGRFNAAMAAEPHLGSLLRFGGWDGEGRRNGTWRLVKNRWSEISQPQSPPARNHSSMAHDPARQRSILFGGHDGQNIFGDLWEWDGQRWLALGGEPPRRRVSNGH
ncbi:MAG: hypothetical protein AAF604_02290 [Acidobacteriota bacterium]